MNHKPHLIILITALFHLASAAPDSLFSIFSAAVPHSAVSRSLAGAGTALPHGGFDGLVNPALSSAGGREGVMAAGYGRSSMFDGLALPFGTTVMDVNGAIGFYYGYYRGERGSVHDAVMNFAGRMFEQVDKQGPVEFGLNLRYEQSKWRHDGEADTVNLYGKNILIDIGFYQLQAFTGFDFSLVFKNLTGYGWNNIDGADKSNGWVGGRHRTIIAGMLISIPAWNGLILRLPVDFEMANLFEKTVPNKYVARAGIDLQIAGRYNARFGYAYAPEDPLELVTDFDYKNLFFGGIGVTLKPVQVDVFAGKDEFGVTATYYY
jgi:hypothetical protein